MIVKAITRGKQATHRIEAMLRRTDRRQSVRERYARTRHLIDLGALVEKSGLIDLIGGDQEIFYGAMIHLVTQARSADAGALLIAWQQLGKRYLSTHGVEDRRAIASDEGSAR